MRTKVLASSAIILGAAVGLGASADADPSVFKVLSCSCPERAPADSAVVVVVVVVVVVEDAITRGIRQGLADVPAAP